eukprot:5183925-Amphidinium_carterae.1
MELLREANAELRGDRDFVLRAVRRDGRALMYAAEELRGDRDLVMVAVREKGWALKFATETLRGDRGLVMEAVRKYGSALEHAAEELRGDRDLVMEAVRETGSALQYAAEELRGDREVVLQAVAQNGEALRFAPEHLREDGEMLDAALGCATGEISSILRSLGLDGHFALRVSLISGASRSFAVSRGTSASAVKAAVLPHLARRMQHAFEPDVADYACVVGRNEIPDHLEVEAWPGIE